MLESIALLSHLSDFGVLGINSVAFLLNEMHYC